MVSEVYELLRSAAMRRQPVADIYDGQPRVLCPHVGGWKEGRRNVFCYQFGGRSNSIELLPTEGKVYGVASEWRDSAKSSCTSVIGTPNHDPSGRPVLMRWILISTLSQETIRKTDNEAVPVVSGAPG